MLSDERIRQFAEDIYCSEGTRAEIEQAIRAALAESAQVPVMGEAVAYGVPNSAITGMRHRLMQVMLDIPKQAQYPELLVPLFEKPATSITQAELDALRNAARALNALLDRELHILDKEVVFPFESHTQAWNHIVDARQIADKAMAIAKERQS
jgi:hypothetical protein